MEIVNLTLKFVNSSSGNIVPTGDLLPVFAIFAVLILSGIGLMFFTFNKQNQVVIGKHVMTSEFVKTKNLSYIGLSFIIACAFVCATICSVMLSNLNFAYAQNNSALVPENNEIIALVNEDGTINVANCSLTNTGTTSYLIDKTEVNITKDCQAVEGLQNCNFAICGFDGVLFNGRPNSEAQNPVDISYLKSGLSTVLSFNIDGIDSQTALSLVDKDVFTVSLIPKYVESIDITKNPDKMNYTIGEQFDPTGMVVTVNYSNGTAEKISDPTLLEWSPKVFDAEGIHVDVTVSFQGCSDTVAVSVGEYWSNVYGRVLTTNHNRSEYIPLEDAEVIFMANDSLIQKTKTDKNGFYSFSWIKSGTQGVVYCQYDKGVGYYGERSQFFIVDKFNYIAPTIYLYPLESLEVVFNDNTKGLFLPAFKNYELNADTVRFLDKDKNPIWPSDFFGYYKMSDLCTYNWRGELINYVHYVAFLKINDDTTIKGYCVTPSGRNNALDNIQNKEFVFSHITNLGVNFAVYSPYCSNWDINTYKDETCPTLNGVNYSAPVKHEGVEHDNWGKPSTFYECYQGLLTDNACNYVWGSNMDSTYYCYWDRYNGWWDSRADDWQEWGTCSIVLEKEFGCKYYSVTGVVNDTNKCRVPNADVSMFDENNFVVAKTHTDNEGKYSLLVKEGVNGKLFVEKEEYSSSPLPVSEIREDIVKDLSARFRYVSEIGPLSRNFDGGETVNFYPAGNAYIGAIPFGYKFFRKLVTGAFETVMIDEFDYDMAYTYDKLMDDDADVSRTLYFCKSEPICDALNCFATVDTTWNDVFEISEESSNITYPVEATKIKDSFKYKTDKVNVYQFTEIGKKDGWNHEPKGAIDQTLAYIDREIYGPWRDSEGIFKGYYNCYGENDGGLLSAYSNLPLNILAFSLTGAYVYKSVNENMPWQWEQISRDDMASVILVSQFHEYV